MSKVPYRVCRACVGAGKVAELDGKPIPELLTRGWKKVLERADPNPVEEP